MSANSHMAWLSIHSVCSYVLGLKDVNCAKGMVEFICESIPQARTHLAAQAGHLLFFCSLE